MYMYVHMSVHMSVYTCLYTYMSVHMTHVCKYALFPWLSIEVEQHDCMSTGTSTSINYRYYTLVTYTASKAVPMLVHHSTGTGTCISTEISHLSTSHTCTYTCRNLPTLEKKLQILYDQ